MTQLGGSNMRKMVSFYYLQLRLAENGNNFDGGLVS